MKPVIIESVIQCNFKASIHPFHQSFHLSSIHLSTNPSIYQSICSSITSQSFHPPIPVHPSISSVLPPVHPFYLFAHLIYPSIILSAHPSLPTHLFIDLFSLLQPFLPSIYPSFFNQLISSIHSICLSHPSVLPSVDLIYSSICPPLHPYSPIFFSSHLIHLLSHFHSVHQSLQHCFH